MAKRFKNDYKWGQDRDLRIPEICLFHLKHLAWRSHFQVMKKLSQIKDTYKKPSKSVINLLWLDLRLTFFMNLFHKSNQGLTDNTINDITIRSKQSINALGIQFDSKMNWKQQISNTINKSRQALITCHQTNKKIFCQKDFQ